MKPPVIYLKYVLHILIQIYIILISGPSTFRRCLFSNWSTVFKNKQWSWISNLHCTRTRTRKIRRLSLWYLSFLLLACHKKSYLICPEFSNFRILRNIYLFSSSCLCPVGCLSFVRWKKNQNKYYVIFENSTIRHIPNSFSYEKPGTLR